MEAIDLDALEREHRPLDNGYCPWGCGEAPCSTLRLVRTVRQMREAGEHFRSALFWYQDKERMRAEVRQGEQKWAAALSLPHLSVERK